MVLEDSLSPGRRDHQGDTLSQFIVSVLPHDHHCVLLDQQAERCPHTDQHLHFGLPFLIVQ